MKHKENKYLQQNTQKPGRVSDRHREKETNTLFMAFYQTPSRHRAYIHI